MVFLGHHCENPLMETLFVKVKSVQGGCQIDCCFVSNTFIFIYLFLLCGFHGVAMWLLRCCFMSRVLLHHIRVLLCAVLF